MGATGLRRKFGDIFSLWIQYTNARDGQRDRHTKGQTDGHQTTAKTALTHSVAR